MTSTVANDERMPKTAAPKTLARPIVKWAGGKSRLLGAILPRVPTEIRTYVEPFMGGAALFFALASESSQQQQAARRFTRAVLWDQNPELCACYRAVRDDVGAVISALEGYRYDKELFYEVRERDTHGMSDVSRAARFIFLNKTCFNGLWRVNSRGKFNVPFGRYDDPKILDRDALLAASKALACADIGCGDYGEATRGLGPGDFVYFDPPYDPASKTSDFTSYASGGFSYGDQQRLADEMRRLRSAGVLALLSNADTPAMRELYFDFQVHSVEAPRSINSVGDKRGMARELLVASWEQPTARARRRSKAT